MLGVGTEPSFVACRPVSSALDTNHLSPAAARSTKSACANSIRTVQQELRRLLKSSGSVFISVPNFGSLQAGIFRRRWFHLDPARHLFHYERKTLAEVCERNGFAATWRTTKSLEYGVFGWWQSFFNLLPFDFNMGYKILKGRKKYTMTAANVFALLVYGLLAVPVGILSVALMFIEAALGKGAVLQVRLTPTEQGKS